jgi:hypothetical protein
MKRMMAVVRERVMRRIVVRVRVMLVRLRGVEEVNERCGRWWWEDGRREACMMCVCEGENEEWCG